MFVSPSDERHDIVESKRLITSGSSWEEAFGFSRAVEADGWLYISKTGPLNSGGEIESDDISLQMECVLNKIKGILESSGYAIDDVIQSRLYLTEIEEIMEKTIAFEKVRLVANGNHAKNWGKLK